MSHQSCSVTEPCVFLTQAERHREEHILPCHRQDMIKEAGCYNIEMCNQAWAGFISGNFVRARKRADSMLTALELRAKLAKCYSEHN